MIGEVMKDTLVEAIKDVLGELGVENPKVVLSYPEELSFGEFTTNVAMAYAKELGKNPKELAEEIREKLSARSISYISTIEVAGPGFINFSLSREYYSSLLVEIIKEGDQFGKSIILSGKKVMIEYTQPNPFKPFHIGHLMSNAIGESLSRIIESQGAQIIRANYQGDVGPHVAKAIYGIFKKGKPDATLPLFKQAQIIGEYYAWGNTEYETNNEAKTEIERINKAIYEKSDEAVNELYVWGREVTLKAFEVLYTLLGTKFDYYFFESDTAVSGRKIVEERLKDGVFENSDGAIVFHGEKYDPTLHTRVFINSQGLPTYEAKELGLTKMKFDLENPDLSIVTTAVEQKEYMRVVLKAVEILYPEYSGKIMHINHGMMRFTTGKMSSRLGNVITGESLVNDAVSVVTEIMKDRDMSEVERKAISEIVAVSAIKFSILRQATGGDIIFDFENSISFEGDSGPYLLYSVTRAKSAIAKALEVGIEESVQNPASKLTPLEQLLGRFPFVVSRAHEEYAPHHIVTYLLALSGAFNAFYAHNPIAQKENPDSPYNLMITKSFVSVIQNGLSLLGIKVPSKM
jgi:arginyl-tRNA synthetase